MHKNTFQGQLFFDIYHFIAITPAFNFSEFFFPVGDFLFFLSFFLPFFLSFFFFFFSFGKEIVSSKVLTGYFSSFDVLDIFMSLSTGTEALTCLQFLKKIYNIIIIVNHINSCPSRTLGGFCRDVVCCKCHYLTLGLIDSCLKLTKAGEVQQLTFSTHIWLCFPFSW